MKIYQGGYEMKDILDRFEEAGLGEVEVVERNIVAGSNFAYVAIYHPKCMGADEVWMKPYKLGDEDDVALNEFLEKVRNAQNIDGHGGSVHGAQAVITEQHKD